MKRFLLILALVWLAGCRQQPVQEGLAEFIHYRTGPNTSTLLTGQDFKGQSSATETLRYRNPHVVLRTDYIEISYPGTDQKAKLIPRESLIELEWKK
jgi:hypothetical protein